MDRFKFKHWKRNKYGDYRMSASNGSHRFDIVIHHDTYDKYWWSSDLMGHYRLFRDIKTAAKQWLTDALEEVAYG